MSAPRPTAPQVVRFGLFEVDLPARELRRNGIVVKLQDRPFEILCVLLERPGDVITRDEFRQRLWPADTFVDFDPSLNTSVNKLRQALSDNAENPRFIATVGRRGYRFIAPAIVVKPSASMDAPEPPAAEFAAPREPVRGSSRAYAALAISAVLVVVIFVFVSLAPEPVPKVSNLVQISHDGLLDPWGRITTDGARVFYLDRTGGHWDLMQVPASGGESQPFSEHTQNIRVVDISPDHSLLLAFPFHGRSNDLPISLLPVVGGALRRVGDIVADDAVFSPDGRRIFFDSPDGIYSCELDGSRVKRLVALPGRSEYPRWSKDARRLRFTLNDTTTGGTSIWEVSQDGSHLHAVPLSLSQPGMACCGRWSSDGRYFFFVWTRDELQTLWALRESGRTLLSPPPKPVQLTFAPNDFGGLIPSQDPSRVFAWGGNELIETARYYPASGRVQPLLPGIDSIDVSLSPDGQSLAFSKGGDLWRSQSDGGARQPLVSGFAQIDQIAWSPDAKRILFQSSNRGEQRRFFLVPSDGGTATQLSLGGGNNEPVFSPDGRTILFAKWANEGAVTRAQSGIFLLDLETSRIDKIPGSEGLIHPLLSPDQKLLAAVTNFDLNPDRPTQLMLYNFHFRRWTGIAHGTLVNPAQWSKDSKDLFYQDILGESQPVFRYSVPSNRSQPFAEFNALLHSGYVRCSFLGFAPDAALTMSLRRNEVNIYRLDLDLP